MKRLLIIWTLLTILFSVSATQFSTSQTKAIETIVHDYLVQHPEVVTEAIAAPQQHIEQQKNTLEAVVANQAALFNAGDTQVAGNPNGSVTLVAFFDYQCIHSAHLYQQRVIARLIKNNPELRVIYKDYPIFGAASVYAAKAAMAANEQGKYLLMREAIFNTGKIEGKLTSKDIDTVAAMLDLNLKQYHQAINGDAIHAHLMATVQLANTLGIQGTPALIIAPTPTIGNAKGKISFIPGATGVQQLQQAIDVAK